jgi:hypothetical protein
MSDPKLTTKPIHFPTLSGDIPVSTDLAPSIIFLSLNVVLFIYLIISNLPFFNHPTSHRALYLRQRAFSAVFIGQIPYLTLRVVQSASDGARKNNGINFFQSGQMFVGYFAFLHGLLDAFGLYLSKLKGRKWGKAFSTYGHVSCFFFF